MFPKAFTVPTVLAAFHKTGIHPYNPDIITPQMMKESEPSSLIGSLPIPMPTPIMPLWWPSNARSYTAADLDPDHFHAPPTLLLLCKLSMTELTTPQPPHVFPNP